MLISRWIIAVAFGLAIAGLLDAQEIRGQSTAEDQRMHEEGAADADNARENQQQQAIDFSTSLKGIEAAIRDLIAEEDKVGAQAQEDREKRDLLAQESMARWAMWMFYAASATVLLTFAALIAIILTLHHTKRAAIASEGMLREAEKATKATFGAVDAAKDANVASARAAKIDQRPWLSVDIVEFQHVKVEALPASPGLGLSHLSATVILRIINTGKTPAQAVEIWVDACRYEELHATLKTIILKESEGDKHHLIGVIPPNSETTLDFPIRRSFIDFPDLEDFEFQCRLFCSIRYSTDASLKDGRDGLTLQTFVIESNDGDRRSIWIDTRDIRLLRAKFEARPAVGRMT